MDSIEHDVGVAESELLNPASASLILVTGHENSKAISLSWSFSESSLSMKKAQNVRNKFNRENLKRNELELCQRKEKVKKEVVKFVEISKRPSYYFIYLNCSLALQCLL